MSETNSRRIEEPLPSRIRPETLDEFVGQEHLVGEGKPLRVAIEQQRRFSFILWGPPGCGKTTLARIYARALEANLFELSAVSAGKDDIRRVVASLDDGKPTILFLDEIHRFNKAQQDYLLPLVERGELTLIGATTENPSFEVIAPLLSRCHVFTLSELSEDEIGKIVDRAGIPLEGDARAFLVRFANGDARKALTILEGAWHLYGEATVETLRKTAQTTSLRYDRAGDEHYDTVSAFIKSMRAGQPDAALYYLARMVEAGEDPKFIARRMVIFASEDIGMAQPTALVVANEVFRAVETVGLPEAAINLAHGAVYLASAKKDRSAYEGFCAAREDVKRYGNLPIPLILRNPVTKLMASLGYGKGEEGEGDLLPKRLRGKKYWKPKPSQ
jgi:putative ATPase